MRDPRPVWRCPTLKHVTHLHLNASSQSVFYLTHFELFFVILMLNAVCPAGPPILLMKFFALLPVCRALSWNTNFAVPS